MDTTIEMGRPPSVEPSKGTAIARNTRAAELAPAAGVTAKTDPRPLQELTAVARLGARMELDVDRPTGLVIGRLVDFETGKVVDQIPSREAVKLLERTRRIIGAILDKMA